MPYAEKMIAPRSRPAMPELTLTVLALVCAAVSPNIFVAGGLGLAPMSALAKYALLPAVAIQVGIILYARSAGYSRLFNRLVTALWIGAVATTGLDVVRLPGTFFGYLGHDEARMAGEMMLSAPGDEHTSDRAHGESTRQMPSIAPSLHGSPTAEGREAAHAGGRHAGGTRADFVGYPYHYWNGTSFAVIYTLLFGRTTWWGPVLYSVLFVETGMLLFMQAAMGPLTWGIVIVSLLAHVIYGLVLGVLLKQFVRHDGTILYFLLPSPEPQRA